VVVVDVGATEVLGAIADLDGVFTSRTSVPTHRDDIEAGGARSLRDLFGLVDNLVADAMDRRPRPRGVAIGVPGVVRHPGTVEWAPALGWRELALGDLIAIRTGLPTFIENDVNLLALGEHRRGAGFGTHTMVALAIEAGLGGGLIIGDQLHRGANSSAGEVGYLLTGRDSLDRIYPGFGDLEGRVAGAALARRAADIGVSRSTRDATPSDLFSAANRGDARAAAVVADVVDLLALTVANISVLLDPELIVIGGRAIDSIQPIIDGVTRRLVGRIPHPPRIERSALGADAILTGAAALAIEQTADYAYVRPPESNTRLASVRDSPSAAAPREPSAAGLRVPKWAKARPKGPGRRVTGGR
jgi:predicted NBD/HSP70 family sugar kinase